MYFLGKNKGYYTYKEKLRAKERLVMDAKEILWNYFLKTGEIGSYLLIKEIEEKDDSGYVGGNKESERISLERSDNIEEQGL